MHSNVKYAITKQLKRVIIYNLYRRIQCAIKIRQIKKNNECRVLFIASSLPMWRYHDVIGLLRADSRFIVKIAIIPFNTYSKEERSHNIAELKNYFNSVGLDYEVVNDFAHYKKDHKPQIIVYPQPYEGIYTDNSANWTANIDCLLVHTPYSVPITESKWYINNPFHNIAWKLYVASDIHQDVSRRIADNQGRNTVVVGEPHSDIFFKPAGSDPWKSIPDKKKRKRLIWAPHFSIFPNMFDRPDFIWSYEVIQKIAEDCQDKLQIAFKPHPRLRSELYKHPEWGKERTDEFYNFWKNSPNTQLETGEYIDLFKTSDAMIHNCGSFTVEYLFVNKPVAYITRNPDGIMADMNAFGRECQSAHYNLTSSEEIRHFIENVIIKGNDQMKEKRDEISHSLLRAPGGRSVAENIYNDLVKSLFGS